MQATSSISEEELRVLGLGSANGEARSAAAEQVWTHSSMRALRNHMEPRTSTGRISSAWVLALPKSVQLVAQQFQGICI
jgi:hypothetical protein